MKIIGVIGAMEEEISAIKPKLERVSSKIIGGMEFFLGHLGAATVVLVRSGIGKVNAALCVQILCNMYAVDWVINTGVAGALDPELSICDVVISTDVAQHDFDATHFGYAPGMIPRMPESFFPADKGLFESAIASCQGNIRGKAMTGRIASGDLFVTRNEDRERIINTFGALCVEMEGAAIGHACYLNKIPFVIIRAMSDTASEGAAEDFDKFAKEAAAQSAAIVETMILAV